MTTVYLVRHGYSLANEKDLFLGHGDMGLTEKGKLQAEVASNYLASLKPDVIYSSDLKRAYDTSLPTAKKLGIQVIKDKRLREIDAGDWDKINFYELKKLYPETFNVWLNDITNARCDGGESYGEMLERFKNAITEIAKNNDGKTVMVFAHATPIYAFTANTLGYEGKDVYKLKNPPNVSTTTLTFADDKFTLVEYGKNDYLGDLATTLPEL